MPSGQIRNGEAPTTRLNICHSTNFYHQISVSGWLATQYFGLITNICDDRELADRVFKPSQDG